MEGRKLLCVSAVPGRSAFFFSLAVGPLEACKWDHGRSTMERHAVLHMERLVAHAEVCVAYA